MNEKDKLAAEEIGYAFQDLLGFAARVDLENRIVGALTTARQEARAGAFTQMGLELPPSDLPFDDYCAGAGDCRACAGVNCTCPHHAPNANLESLYATCRRVWVCKRCGNCLDHCKHKDESNFHEDLVMPCSARTAPAEPRQEGGQEI